ncbi:MAG: alpha/beta hydrolase [Acidobacteriota bacterium]
MLSVSNPLSQWAFLSREERNRAYNNAAAVSNSSTLIQARDQASAAYRSTRKGTIDLAYGTGQRQAWDLYPGTDPSAPCLVFFHGGYWQMNGRENFACIAEGVASHGWSVALPGFTLAPEASLEQIVAENRMALDWLRDHLAQYQLGSKVMVAGWSAGAHLAALALAHPMVSAGLAISGVYELAPLRDTYLNDKLSLTDLQIETLSPLRLEVVNKPLAIAYGSAELPALIEDARSFHRVRADAHAPGSLLPVARANHYTILDELRAPDGLLVRAVLDLAR